jgi:hypothetical protein
MTTNADRYWVGDEYDEPTAEDIGDARDHERRDDQ